MRADFFTPSPIMSFTTVEYDRQRLIAWCQSLNSASLVLNLAEVTHCDSAGLAFLIEAKRLARRYNTSCIIKHIPDEVDALARFSGLEHILVDNESK